MLIDTHCHLDASEFLADRQAVIQRAAEQGVGAIVMTAGALSNFDVVRELAHSFKGGVDALGIHPRWEEGRVGKEWVSRGRDRWRAKPDKEKKERNNHHKE